MFNLTQSEYFFPFLLGCVRYCRIPNKYAKIIINMKLFDSYHPYAMITILCWSLAHVFTRIAVLYVSAFSLGVLRYFVASIVLIIIAIIFKIKIPHKTHLPLFLLSGASGFFLYMIAFNKGNETVSASTSSIIIATVPVITALLARIIYKEKIKPYRYCGMTLECMGVLIITMFHGIFTINRGIVWLLGAAILLSVYNILQKKLIKLYSPLQITVYSIFMGELLLCIFLPETIGVIRDIPKRVFAYIAILGIFSSAIAYFTWSKAFSKAKEISAVSNYMFITPFLTSILGFLIIRLVH